MCPWWQLIWVDSSNQISVARLLKWPCDVRRSLLTVALMQASQTYFGSYLFEPQETLLLFVGMLSLVLASAATMAAPLFFGYVVDAATYKSMGKC